MTKFLQPLFLLLLLALLLSACSGLKYVPAGQKLYTGSQVKFDAKEKLRNQDALQAELTGLIRPQPNGSILGMRPKLYFWHLGVGKTKGLKKFLADRLGEAPVLITQADPAKTSRLMVNRLQNRGYFNAGARYEVKTKDNTASIDYTVTPQQQYVIQEIHFPERDTLVDAAIRATAPNSLLKVGDPYDLDLLTQERVRVDQALKNQGYFYFNPGYLLFQVDSTLRGKVNVYYKVKAETPAQATRPYWLKTISLNTNYQLTDTLRRPPVMFRKYRYFPDEKVFKASAITRATFLFPDSLYRQKRRDQTLSRLMSLGTFRYVDMRFRPSAAGDSAGRGRLDADVLMTQLKKKSLRAEVQLVTKTNGFTGPGLTAQFRNRSALRGAEQLVVNAVATYEFQTQVPENVARSGETRGASGLLSTEFGVDAQLLVPRLIVPRLPLLNPRLPNSDFQPRTTFGLGARYVTRTNYFRTISYTANYGYAWKRNLLEEQELRPIDVVYNQVFVEPAFQEILDQRQFLRAAFEKQFVLGSSYRYTYNQQVLEQRRQQIFFQGQVEVSGNLANAVTGALNTPTDALGRRTIGGQTFAQYAKFDLELREYFRVSANSKSGNRFVGRLQIGVGLPYGNSEGGSLPYLRQYGIGGPNSIRAFAPRAIGPGTYRPTPGTIINNFYDQVGDLRLEGNLEYRQDLFPYVKGAAFVDAGNIWLANPDPSRPGAEFQASTFLRQLAIGAGLGLRIDVQFFVIRFDYALPIRANYGVPDSRTGRLNLAIGYPF